MRAIEEIQQDYAKAATVAGDIGYRITQMKADLRATERKMKQLNIEAQGVANAKANAEKEATDGTKAEQADA